MPLLTLALRFSAPDLAGTFSHSAERTIMGIIDSTIHALRCDNCGIEEEKKTLEKGSNWGSSGWQEGPDFEHFYTDWSGGGKVEPRLRTATCKRCGVEAFVESRYGG